MVLSSIRPAGMCHHWEELPVEDLDAEAEHDAEDVEDVQQEAAPA